MKKAMYTTPSKCSVVGTAEGRIVAHEFSWPPRLHRKAA